MFRCACPACGAEIQFKSRFSVFGVCTYCTSTVVRHDMDLENLGKMAELPADMSPLQIGTRGRYQGQAFEIVGRLKLDWEDGMWNEWYVLFEKGEDGWLAEAQGFYMMSSSQNIPHQIMNAIPPLSQISVGKKIADFEVDDIKKVTCVGSEGELPFSGAFGRKSTSVDLSGPGKRFGCIDYASNEIRIYLGKYVDFDELCFTNLRELEGW